MIRCAGLNKSKAFFEQKNKLIWNSNFDSLQQNQNSFFYSSVLRSPFSFLVSPSSNVVNSSVSRQFDQIMNSNSGLIQIWNVSNSSINLTETINSSVVTFRPTENDLKYFGLFFDSLHRLYLPYHGFLALAVCIFGIVSNILNITVLTRWDDVTKSFIKLTVFFNIIVLMFSSNQSKRTCIT